MDPAGLASTWERSHRAVNVVKLLIKVGVGANDLAATGFADFQPLATGKTADEYAKNRRKGVAARYPEALFSASLRVGRR